MKGLAQVMRCVGKKLQEQAKKQKYVEVSVPNFEPISHQEHVKRLQQAVAQAAAAEVER